MEIKCLFGTFVSLIQADSRMIGSTLADDLSSVILEYELLSVPFGLMVRNCGTRYEFSFLMQMS